MRDRYPVPDPPSEGWKRLDDGCRPADIECPMHKGVHLDRPP